MRRLMAILSVVVMVLVAAGMVAQAKPSFNPQAKPSFDPQAKPSFNPQAKPSFNPQAKPSFAGDWMMLGPDGRGNPATTLTIRQSATAISLEYVGCDPAPAPAKLTYKLDGSVSKNMLPGRGDGAPVEQVATAMWAANKIVVTTTTSAGEEKRTFSMEGGNLVVDTTASVRNGGAPNVTKATYTRYECGLGG